jgi:hypothetical protein
VAIWIADGSNSQLLLFPGGRIKEGKVVKVAGLKSPFDVVIDDQNRVWVSNSQSDTLLRLPADDPSKVETFHAGISVRALALDSNRNVWFASNMSLNFPKPKIPDGASMMQQFQLLGQVMVAYPTSTGLVSMFRPDGTQVSPQLGFTGGGVVDIPWGLNIEGNDDVWIGNFGGRGVILMAGAEPKGRSAGTKKGDISRCEIGAGPDASYRSQAGYAGVCPGRSCVPAESPHPDDEHVR